MWVIALVFNQRVWHYVRIVSMWSHMWFFLPQMATRELSRMGNGLWGEMLTYSLTSSSPFIFFKISEIAFSRLTFLCIYLFIYILAIITKQVGKPVAFLFFSPFCSSSFHHVTAELRELLGDSTPSDKWRTHSCAEHTVALPPSCFLNEDL